MPTATAELEKRICLFFLLINSSFECLRGYTAIKPLKLNVLAGILTLALGVPAVQAYYMELTGSRVSTDPNQLVSTGAFSAGPGFQIAWNITEASAGTALHYEYTISGADGGALRRTLRHWILEVANPATPGDFINFSGIREPYEGQHVPAVWQPTRGSRGQPGDLFGISFTSKEDYVKGGSQIYTFSFDSFCLPVWGDFYAGGSNGVYAYNPGFGTDPDLFTTDFGPWILVPGADSTAPLPGSVLLLGSGLVGLGLVRFRLRQKRAHTRLASPR